MRKLSSDILRDLVPTVAVSVLITLILLFLAWREVILQEREVFEFESGLLKKYVLDGAKSSNAVAQGLQAFFHASQHVDVDEFDVYLKEVFPRYPYIYAIQYAPQVSSDERAAFEEDQRYWGWITFSVFEFGPKGGRALAGNRAIYFPTIYKEPFAPEDASIIGFDILSSPVYKKTIMRAIESGMPIPTGPVKVSNEGRWGYELFIAVYEGKKLPESAEAKKQKVNGLLRLSINSKVMFDVAKVPTGLFAELSIITSEKSTETTQLFRLTPKSLQDKPRKPLYTLTSEQTIQVLKQKFLLSIKKPLFYNNLNHMLLWFALAISLIFGASIYLITRGRRKLKKELMERRQAQTELANHRDHLEDLIVERTRELTATKEKAEAATRAKSEFLANMSHEIRTPLNAVTGFSELLSSLVTDPKQKNYLEAIKTAGKSLLTLINDILDLTKIEANKLVINYGLVKPRMILTEIEQIFKVKVDNKNIEFSIEVDDGLPAILIIDETRLRQILLNLVGNAVKFTEKGYIKLSAKVLKAHSDKQIVDVRIAVEDSGIGISENGTRHIFDPFQQQDELDSRKYGGTGLGLAICKRLVEAMDGRIYVSSTENKGSTFAVILENVGYMAAVNDQSSSVFRGDIKEIVFDQARVLVVDDIPSNRNLLREMLNKVNLDVMTAVNGEEALILLGEHNFDLIIMDIRMPVMDGIEANIQIKANPDTKDIPVIALTASAKSEDKETILQRGFDRYLTKPFKMNNLLTEIAQYLSYHPKQKALPVNINQSPEAVESQKVNADLAAFLTEEMLHRCSLIERTMVIDEVEQFAKDVQKIGLDNEVEQLISFGRDLNSSVQIFDIGEIKEKLRQFPDIVQKSIR